MQIELAGTRDAPLIASLSRDLIETGLGWSWQPARVLRAIRNPEAAVIKAIDDEIAGFAIMRFGQEDAHLDLLAVRPAYRRQGVATLMLRWLEKSALTAGVSIIRLELRESNRGARRFYERHGYSFVRTVDGYYQGREAALQMARDLWCDVEVRPA
jgi:ribosomal-protein-alanine N-acetyltransferase